MPELKSEAIALGRDERLHAILRDICDTTGMRFAAVARITEQRWIACQVEDRIELGLDPATSSRSTRPLVMRIRESGEAVVIDDTSDDIKWSRHPVPVIYRFKSYCSFPVYLDDGTSSAPVRDRSGAAHDRRGHPPDVGHLCQKGRRFSRNSQRGPETSQ